MGKICAKLRVTTDSVSRSVFTVPPVYTARRRRDALGMSGKIVLYAPLILML